MQQVRPIWLIALGAALLLAGCGDVGTGPPLEDSEAVQAVIDESSFRTERIRKRAPHGVDSRVRAGMRWIGRLPGVAGEVGDCRVLVPRSGRGLRAGQVELGFTAGTSDDVVVYRYWRFAQDETTLRFFAQCLVPRSGEGIDEAWDQLTEIQRRDVAWQSPRQALLESALNGASGLLHWTAGLLGPAELLAFAPQEGD